VHIGVSWLDTEEGVAMAPKVRTAILAREALDDTSAQNSVHQAIDRPFLH